MQVKQYIRKADLKTAQGFLYLSIIRDLYDNSIVAYKMDKEQSIKLVLDTIKAAKRKGKITAEVQLHCDQGFQYTSHAYFKPNTIIRHNAVNVKTW